MTSSGASAVVTVRANADAANGNGNDEIGMADGTVINAGAGKIMLQTTGVNGGSITVGRLVSTSNAIDAIRILSAAAVIDGGDTGGANVDVANGRLGIDAVSGVGAGNALETSAASFDVNNTGAYAVELAKYECGHRDHRKPDHAVRQHDRVRYRFCAVRRRRSDRGCGLQRRRGRGR